MLVNGLGIAGKNRIRHRYEEEGALERIATHGAQEGLTEVGGKVLEGGESGRFHC
jgi:hypothetical protein